jgi:prepilin-type N-terminal cleavage/methylation domain-containing protein
MKQNKLQKMKQKGFTLLELLVVITLLAILSVGALVAYEGIGENAQEVGAANSIKTADSSIRTFRAVEGRYPNQWDNLVNLDDGAVNNFIATQTQAFIAPFDLAAANTANAALATNIGNALNSVGINEFQSLTSAAVFPAGTNPNEAWNESAPGVTNPADELELADDNGVLDLASLPTAANLSVFASGAAGTGCTAGGQNLANAVGGAVLNSTRLNRINDTLDNDGCHLVVAVGFGKDVPGTTVDSRVSISTAPTYVSNTINPSVNYARYIALLHLGSADEDGTTPTVIQAEDIRAQAKLIAVVDTEGRAIDESIAGAYQQ